MKISFVGMMALAQRAKALMVKWRNLHWELRALFWQSYLTMMRVICG